MMTTELAPTVTSDQLDLIKRTVANGATADELKLFLYDCARQGVHPMDKLVHFTKRGGKYTPVTSIDFMRIRAAETGEYAGNDDAVFHPKPTGATPETSQPPSSATVTVYRLVQGQRCAYTGTARWAEYKPEQNDFMWKKMPHTMLGKCAEAIALRKGFPRQLAGLYAREEMDQAAAAPTYTVEPDPPAKPKVKQFKAEPEPDPAPADDPALPPGAVHLVRVEAHPTKNASVTRFVIVLSTGESVTTIDPWKSSLAEQFCKDHTPAKIKTKTTKWGDELVAIMRADETEPREPPPLTADDIPF